MLLHSPLAAAGPHQRQPLIQLGEQALWARDSAKRWRVMRLEIPVGLRMSGRNVRRMGGLHNATNGAAEEAGVNQLAGLSTLLLTTRSAATLSPSIDTNWRSAREPKNPLRRIARCKLQWFSTDFVPSIP